MRILLFGDSIAQGYYDLEMGGWVNLLYLDILKRKARTTDYPTEVFNVAVSGDTIPRIINRLENEIDSRRWEDEPIVLIFAIGINDTLLSNDKPNSTIEQYREHLEELHAIASKHSENIYFVGLTTVYEPETTPWIFNTGSDNLTWKNDRIADFDKALAAFAVNKGTTFISVFDAFIKQQGAGTVLHTDGLHPNAAGHKLIYEHVKAATSNILNPTER